MIFSKIVQYNAPLMYNFGLTTYAHSQKCAADLNLKIYYSWYSIAVQF